MPKPFKKKSTAKPVGNLFAVLLKNIDKQRAQQPWLVVAAWGEIAGRDFADYTRALSFKQGVLTVLVEDSVVFSQLKNYENNRLLEALQKRLPEHSIRKLFFKMASIKGGFHQC